MGSMKQVVEIDYTNWRGERSKRRIVPMGVSWENNEWHPETQWMLEALDVDKRERRTFALANIHSWTPAPMPDSPRTRPDAEDMYRTRPR
jgi:predicted DNA-binding transcriptional regulator YafY